MASPKAMATTNEHLPEDIIVQILYRLPVKPLIRFSCVSKRWSSIISGPQFAKSHFKLASERKTLSQRLLISTPSQLESLDVKTPSFSSVRKLTCPFKQPGRTVQILGSCNGLVCVALDFHDGYYIWNPSTGLFLKLPNPSIGTSDTILCHYCGFGYVSATDDYKVFVACPSDRNYSTMLVEMFSSRANCWTRIKSTPNMFFFTRTEGTLSNEALHWLHRVCKQQMIAFDLAKEEFREIPLPLSNEDDDDCTMYSFVGVVYGGCLCVSSCISSYDEDEDEDEDEEEEDRDEFQLWVMMEYGVCKSWTKMFKFSLVYDQLLNYQPVLYTESSILVLRSNPQVMENELIRDNLSYKHVANCYDQYYTLEVGECNAITYDETLLWLNDYHGMRGRTSSENKQK